MTARPRAGRGATPRFLPPCPEAFRKLRRDEGPPHHHCCGSLILQSLPMAPAPVWIARIRAKRRQTVFLQHFAFIAGLIGNVVISLCDSNLGFLEPSFEWKANGAHASCACPRRPPRWFGVSVAEKSSKFASFASGYYPSVSCARAPRAPAGGGRRWGWRGLPVATRPVMLISPSPSPPRAHRFS